MSARKTIAFPAELHAAWTAAAAEEGLPLHAWVARAVEAARSGDLPYQAEVARRALAVGEVLVAKGRPRSVPLVVRVLPKNCTNRVRPGTFCKICGAVHR